MWCTWYAMCVTRFESESENQSSCSLPSFILLRACCVLQAKCLLLMAGGLHGMLNGSGQIGQFH